MIHDYQVWEDGQFVGAITLHNISREEISRALGIKIKCLVDDHHHDVLKVNNNIELLWIATIY